MDTVQELQPAESPAQDSGFPIPDYPCLLEMEAPELGQTNIHIYHVPNWRGPDIADNGFRQMGHHANRLFVRQQPGTVFAVYYVKSAKVPLKDFGKRGTIKNKVFKANTLAMAVRYSTGEDGFVMYPFRDKRKRR